MLSEFVLVHEDSEQGFVGYLVGMVYPVLQSLHVALLITFSLLWREQCFKTGGQFLVNSGIEHPILLFAASADEINRLTCEKDFLGQFKSNQTIGDHHWVKLVPLCPYVLLHLSSTCLLSRALSVFNEELPEAVIDHALDHPLAHHPHQRPTHLLVYPRDERSH